MCIVQAELRTYGFDQRLILIGRIAFNGGDVIRVPESASEKWSPYRVVGQISWARYREPDIVAHVPWARYRGPDIVSQISWARYSEPDIVSHVPLARYRGRDILSQIF